MSCMSDITQRTRSLTGRLSLILSCSLSSCNVLGMIQSTACILFLWVAFWTALVISSRDLDSQGHNIEDQDHIIEVFSGSEIASPPPGTLTPKNEMHFMNGDFELINVTGNSTVLADMSMIPNWMPGEAGVQIIQSASYQMSNYVVGGGTFAIHLNNPMSSGNSTQGSLASRNFTWLPKPATHYTVQFDCARLPDGPLNVYPALKVSSMSGIVVNYYSLYRPRYNITDTPRQITWIRESFLLMGTGANTSLLFESMSEKFGPVIDNVVILSGIHLLHPNSATSLLPSLVTMLALLTVLTLPVSTRVQ